MPLGKDPFAVKLNNIKYALNDEVFIGDQPYQCGV
jgi:hypothetical protein